MSSDNNDSPARPTNPERRASDGARLKFGEAALRNVAASPPVPEGEIETINFDTVRAPGSADDFHSTVSPAAGTGLSAAQKRGQLQIIKFKQSFDTFESTSTSGIAIDDVKRGDVVEIKTIVGAVYFRIVDRIKGGKAGVGEVLCECRYDLLDQWHLVHAATITLPVFTRKHIITNPDGSKRAASRALKMATEEELPEHVKNVLHETFFTEIIVHANPEPEKLRAIDVGRWLLRAGLKVKAIIDENNRREEEKKRRLAEEKAKKKEEKARRARGEGEPAGRK